MGAALGERVAVGSGLGPKAEELAAGPSFPLWLELKFQ